MSAEFNEKNYSVKMNKSIESYKKEISTLRTGRANASIAILGQKPITNVGTNRLKPIESSLTSISLTMDKAGILGPKKTLLHIERR